MNEITQNCAMYENLWMKFKSYFAQSLPTGDHEKPHVVVRGQDVLTKTLLWLNRSRRISKKNNFYKKKLVSTRKKLVST